jgi:epoxyqueuosine reductase
MTDLTRPRLLLHVCCGPCSTAVIERLLPDYDVTLFWHNPNLQPAEEAEQRLEAARQVAAALGVEFVVAVGGEAEFAALCQGREELPEGGERCRLCYELRLRRACEYAAAHGHDLVATTLTISPHKPAAVVNEIGQGVAADHGVSFLAADFGKRAGFQRSLQMSRELELYRQTYCGCRWSRRP